MNDLADIVLPELTPEAVYVWRYDLILPADRVQALRSLLSPDEHERADRYKFDHSRRAFVICRTALRRLLGYYLEVAPESLEFDYGEGGKPELTAAPPTAPCFNVAHSGDWALIALTLDHRVGVDIERRQPPRDMNEMAAMSFSPAEVATFQVLPPDQSVEGFFNAWTRKEAFIKATGRGLGFPLHDFDVTLAPGEAARILRIVGDPTPVERWTLAALAPAAGYAGAVAADAPGLRVELFV